MKHVLALSLAVVACSGATDGGPGAGSKPAPSASMAPPPPMAPAPYYVITRPTPAPSSLQACSPTSVGPCVVYGRADTTNGNDREPFEPYACALDDTFVYWASYDSIWRVPKSGGERELVTMGNKPSNHFSGGFTVDAATLTWTGAKTLVRRPMAGGTPTVLPTGVDVASTFVVDATDAYIADARTKGRLVRVPLDGSATTEVDGLDCIVLAVDDANVFCRTLGGIARLPKDHTQLASTLVTAAGAKMLHLDQMLYFDGNNALLRVPVAGGAAVPVPNAPAGFFLLVAAGGALYMADTDTTVRRVPLDGGAVTTLTDGDAGFGTGLNLAADSSGVYRFDTRFTCLLEHVSTSQPYPGVHTCVTGLEEIRIVRAPLVF